MSSTPPVIPPAAPSGLATLEARIVALEAKAKADVSSVVAWVKDKWPHAITWALMIWAKLHGLI